MEMVLTKELPATNHHINIGFLFKVISRHFYIEVSQSLLIWQTSRKKSLQTPLILIFLSYVSLGKSVTTCNILATKKNLYKYQSSAENLLFFLVDVDA